MYQKNFINLVSYISRTNMPYFIKISVLFFSELIFNFTSRFFRHPIKEIKGKVILITGGTGGIGKHLCKVLSANNNLIVITRKYQKNKKNIRYIVSDLEKISTDLNVRRPLISKLKKFSFDLLICNAGVLDTKNKDRNFLINYEAHRILSTVLNLKNIVLVSSCVAITTSMNINFFSYNNNKKMSSKDLFYGESYARSKYLLFYLAGKLKRRGRNVCLVHPGIMNTKLFSNKFSLIEFILMPFIKYFGISTWRGAYNVLNAVYSLKGRKFDLKFWYMNLPFNVVYTNKNYTLEYEKNKEI